MPTETDKQRALEAIQALPDNAPMDEAIERPCFIAKMPLHFVRVLNRRVAGRRG